MVRAARPDERPVVLSILDAAMLETDASVARGELDDVLVASEGNRVLGACVVDGGTEPAQVDAIAVRPGRRGQGIGTALIEAAAARWGALAAEFDRADRPFYAALSFEIESIGGSRCRGVRRVDE